MDPSSIRRESFLAHEQRERAFAVALLVAMNVAAILGMMLLYLLYPFSRSPRSVDSTLRGFLFGEIAWLSIWFSLSSSSLRLRTALVLAALVLYTFGQHCLVRYCVMRWNNPFITAAFSWRDSLRMSVLEFNAGLCFILFIYAVLLPIRHFSGIVVGTTDQSKEDGRGRGQFQIWHWMIWATVVAAPLALTSMTDIRRGDGGIPLLIVRLVTCVACLLFALPVFLTSLRQQQAGIWTGLTLLGVVITGIGGCEFAPFSQPIFEWRTTLTFLAISSVVICLNNVVLRVLGIHLRRTSHVLLSGNRNGE